MIGELVRVLIVVVAGELVEEEVAVAMGVVGVAVEVIVDTVRESDDVMNSEELLLDGIEGSSGREAV